MSDEERSLYIYTCACVGSRLPDEKLKQVAEFVIAIIEPSDSAYQYMVLPKQE